MRLISTMLLVSLVSFDHQCNCKCDDTLLSSCKAHISETIPIGMSYTSGTIFSSTIDDLIQLVNSATRSLDIASFYWTLLSTDVIVPEPDNSSVYGEQLFTSIVSAHKRGVIIRIVVNHDQNTQKSTDLNILKSLGVQIGHVNFTQLFQAGVLHTKFIIADDQSFYLGSANMDWRSFSHVKELGVIVSSCQMLANDLSKIFQVYWHVAQSHAIPNCWPDSFDTQYNLTSPLQVVLNNMKSNVFISSSPKQLNTLSRTDDLTAILSTIEKADKFINIAVMDYYPLYLYRRESKFWPLIDDTLKKVVIEKGIKIRLLVSIWKHSRSSLVHFLRSLDAFRSYSESGSIEVKVFQVPSTEKQSKIPFARVNHNKYMVTDSIGYIGTSNWSAGKRKTNKFTQQKQQIYLEGYICTLVTLPWRYKQHIFFLFFLFFPSDYFSETGGVALVTHEINSTCYRNLSLRDSLIAAFERDWNSQYSYYVHEYEVHSVRVHQVNTASSSHSNSKNTL